MKVTKSVLVILAALLVALPATGFAITIDTAASVLVSNRDCQAGASSICDGFSSIISQSVAGMPGDLSATASLSSAQYGQVDADITLSGIAGAPVIRARSVSGAATRVNTNSIALQRYTYTGTTATTRTFGGTLTYSNVIPAANSAFGFDGASGVLANINLFTLPTATIEVGDTAQSLFNTIFSASLFENATSLGFDNFSDLSNNAAGSASLAATISLNPGDSFFVRVLLQTPSVNGAIIDSSQTFITGFDDATDLIPAAITPVPAPHSIYLLGVALLGLAVARRERRLG